MVIRGESRVYLHYVNAIKEYDRTTLEEVIRLGNTTVVHAGSYRQAAREVQELNFRKRTHVADRIRSLHHVLPSIAPELIKISTRGVIPGYKGFLPPGERRIARYPYILEDADKIVRKLWKDVRAGIMVVCEIEVAQDSGQVVSHSSSIARKKMPDRTLIIDYRIVSDLRHVNL